MHKLDISGSMYDNFYDRYQTSRKRGAKTSANSRATQKTLVVGSGDDPATLFDSDPVDLVVHNQGRSSPFTSYSSVADELHAEPELPNGTNSNAEARYNLNTELMQSLESNKRIIDHSHEQYCTQMTRFKLEIENIANNVRTERLSIEEAAASIDRLSREIGEFAQKCLDVTHNLQGLRMEDILVMMTNQV
ncbi:hypothetical protein VKT23_008021 [Stygiomarasmius scandens]|uniref:Biogenesis of lysosome-related organelles complex 1 subunit 3 n=1 Tax=Marasmiellus scandens TaxID=2682957 RepID=A0ABR1JJ23_9AGAR